MSVVSIINYNDEHCFEKIKLYGKKPDNQKVPNVLKPPNPVEEVGIYCGLKHSEKDFYLTPGNIIKGDLCFLYSGVVKISGRIQGFAYFASPAAVVDLSNQQEQEGTIYIRLLT